jgi:glutamate-1-semialdehyde 2,1-aminomutase
METKESKHHLQDKIIKEGQKYIAGGVVSLNRKVEPLIVFEKAQGCRLYDVSGNEYIDYHAAFSAVLLGHNYDQINSAVNQVLSDNRSLFGTGTTRWEVELCKQLCQVVPSVEKVQITNSGSEATAHAIRLSRAWTEKDHIILTLGGYDGWHNDVARAVLPGLNEIGPRVSPGEYPFLPLSAGIPEATRSKLHVVNFNDLESVEFVMKKYPVAGIITEPILQNVGVIFPKPGYLEGLMKLCEQYQAVCIFDEVKTGFRTALGGYQNVANLKPHLSVFAKAIANGYPMAAIGGKNEIMQLFDHPEPAKKVLLAGTYNAHPISSAAAIKTIAILKDQQVYDYLDNLTTVLVEGTKDLLDAKGIESTIVRNASSFCIYFCESAPEDMHDILENHDLMFDLQFRRALIDQGVYHMPIPCKPASVSYSHTIQDVEITLEATKRALDNLGRMDH